MDRSVS